MRTWIASAIGLAFVMMASANRVQSDPGTLDPYRTDVSPTSPMIPSNDEPSSLEREFYLAEGETSLGEPSTNLSSAQNSDRWKFAISPYAWIPSIDGFLGVNDRGSAYDLEMSDVVNLLDETEMMAYLNLKAKKNRTSFFIDFIYSKMDNITTGDLGLQLPAIVQTDLDLEWEELFLQFGAGYTVCEWTTPAGRKTSLDLQGGGRYLYVAGNDEIVGGPNDRIRIGIDGSENFIEPWIGAMVETELSPCATLVLGGDIGGFGHGEADGTNWQYYAKVQYQISPQVSLDAGYRHMKLEYEDSLGGREFHFDQEVYGPTVGLTFEF